MLSEVLTYINKYFVDVRYTFDAVETDGFSGSFDTSDFVAGQYVSIDNTKVNDGAYLITDVTASKITVDATLTAEATEGVIWGLAIPKALLSIVEDIESHVSSTRRGLKTENQGNRSATYGTATTGGDSSWQSVFASSLQPYMSVYSDKQSWGTAYINRRWSGCGKPML